MRKIFFAVVCLLLCGTAKAQNFVPIVAGVATVDASLGTNAQTSSFLIILNQNVTSLEIIKPKTGQQITIILQQDGTGGRTVSCASDLLNCVTVSSGASSVTSQAFVYNTNTNTWSGLSGTTGGGISGVSSVAQTVPSWLTVTGSPITTSGTLAISPTTAQTSHQVIGTCGTGTTFAPCALVPGDLPANGYTLDQIGNPAAQKTFALGTNNPLGFSSAGVFTSGANNEYVQSTLTGGGTCNTPANNKTDALTGLICTPSSGVTNAFTDALAGYIFVNDSHQGGAGGNVEGVGIYTVCQANANNTKCIGSAPQVQDVASETGTFIEGAEIGVLPQNTTTQGYGQLMSFEGANSQPTFNNMPAVVVQTPTGSGTWTSGFECDKGSILSDGSGVGRCLNIGAQTQTANSASQSIAFSTTTSGNANVTKLLFGQLDANNNVQLAWTGAEANFPGYMSGGTKFTASGCSNSTTVGGATAGSYHSGTSGTCTVTITMGGSIVAANGWACFANDLTTPTDVQHQSTTSATQVTITGTTASGDVINFGCIGY